MGTIWEEDEDKFDIADVERRHEEMEADEKAEALLAAMEAGMEAVQMTMPEVEAARDQQETAEGHAGGAQSEAASAGCYPESDWEAIVEAVLFTMGNSVELRQLAVAIDQSEKVARRVVENLQKRYQRENRGMQIIELDQAYQMATRAAYYENLIRVASAPKKQVLTDVVLETLSIIAYKQPVTKMEISRIRGVSSDHAVNRLIEYGLVYEAGRLDAPGRPALFATTEEFLRRFGVGSTTDLPTMNPEQEEEIIQEVQEELQLQLNASGELAPAEAEASAEAAETPAEDAVAVPLSEDASEEAEAFSDDTDTETEGES